MLDILGRQVASPVQFVKGLHTLYDAGARVFVEVGPKKALHGFVEDVLGARRRAGAVHQPPEARRRGRRSTRRCAGCTPPGWAMPSRRRGRARRQTQPRRRTPADRWHDDRTASAAELGRHRVDVVPTRRRTPRPAAVRAGADRHRAGRHHRRGARPARRRARLRRRERRPDPRRRAVHRRDPAPAPPRDGRQAHHPAGQARDRRSHASRRSTDEADVIKLAGRGAPLDLVSEFGVDADRDAALDAATRLAIGAGFDALRDAGIPLVHALQDHDARHPAARPLGAARRRCATTPASSSPRPSPGYDSFADDLERYFTDRARREQLAALEAVRARMRGDEPTRAARGRPAHPTSCAAIVEAEPVRVRPALPVPRACRWATRSSPRSSARAGPNTQINAACASTTQAVGAGRGLDPGRPVPAGRRGLRRRRHLRHAAALARRRASWPPARPPPTTSSRTPRTPFDQRRHGMIVGMGAAAFVVESADAARERGLQPICEVLGAVTANSAFHGTRLDVDHIGGVMETLLAQAEARGVDRHAIAPETVFVSHETYTPARGGSAAAEINALRQVFGAGRRRDRHRQHQGLHRPRDGRRHRGRRRHQGAGDRARPAGAELQGARSRARSAQPVDRRRATRCGTRCGWRPGSARRSP